LQKGATPNDVIIEPAYEVGRGGTKQSISMVS
jgi:hypothetical protein